MNGPLLLTLIWVIPFVIALASLPVRHDDHQRIKMISLLGTLINLVLVIALTIQFINVTAMSPTVTDANVSQFHFVYKISWFKIMNIEYNIGVDAISVLMMLLTAIVIFCGVLASWNVEKQAKEFFILLNVLVAGVYGVFISIDLFTFFLFYEIAVLPMYLLIGLWGTGKKEYAAMKLTLMLVAGSAFILAGILALYFESGLNTFDLQRFLRCFRFLCHRPCSSPNCALPTLFNTGSSLLSSSALVSLVPSFLFTPGHRTVMLQPPRQSPCSMPEFS